jgi:hypothetical protein
MNCQSPHLLMVASDKKNGGRLLLTGSKLERNGSCGPSAVRMTSINKQSRGVNHSVWVSPAAQLDLNEYSVSSRWLESVLPVWRSTKLGVMATLQELRDAWGITPERVSNPERDLQILDPACKPLRCSGETTTTESRLARSSRLRRMAGPGI